MDEVTIRKVFNGYVIESREHNVALGGSSYRTIVAATIDSAISLAVAELERKS